MNYKELSKISDYRKSAEQTVLRTDVRESVKILPQIIKKYGLENRIIFDSSVQHDNFSYNHVIEGFFLSKEGVPYATIYWQGDSTDGSFSVPVSELVGGHNYPAERDGWYETHSVIRVTAEELANAFKALADYIEPSVVKVRNSRRKLHDMLIEFLNAQKKEVLNKQGALGTKFWDRWYDIGKWFNSNVDRLSTLSEQDVKKEFYNFFYK